MTEQVEYMGKQADFETHGNKINHEDFPVVFY